MDLTTPMLRPLLPAMFCATSLAADPTLFRGTIDAYEIEVELEYRPEGEDTLQGRYRYDGKTDWLTLKGRMFDGQAVALTESWQDEETGAFFLETDADGLVGVWVAGTRDLKAQLNVIRGSLSDLETPQPERSVTGDLEGTYSVAFYWVNGLFAPNYEIGFNGGEVSVTRAGEAELNIWFDFLVGPTYHIASFNGVARQTGPTTYEHNAVLDYGTKPCHLIFSFTDRALSITQKSGSFDCGFGARAHAEFDLRKISDEIKPPVNQ